MVNESEKVLQSFLKKIDFVVINTKNSYKEFVVSNPKAVLNVSLKK